MSPERVLTTMFVQSTADWATDHQGDRLGRVGDTK